MSCLSRFNHKTADESVHFTRGGEGGEPGEPSDCESGGEGESRTSSSGSGSGGDVRGSADVRVHGRGNEEQALKVARSGCGRGKADREDFCVRGALLEGGEGKKCGEGAKEEEEEEEGDEVEEVMEDGDEEAEEEGEDEGEGEGEEDESDILEMILVKDVRAGEEVSPCSVASSWSCRMPLA